MTVIKSSNLKVSRGNNLHKVSFDRRELEQILKIYGHMVSRGEWRDYSISCSYSNATFSIFRRSSERPLFVIIKAPNLLHQNRMYSIVAIDGQIIKHGDDLRVVLKILNKKLLKLI